MDANIQSLRRADQRAQSAGRNTGMLEAERVRVKLARGRSSNFSHDLIMKLGITRQLVLEKKYVTEDDLLAIIVNEQQLHFATF